MTSPVLYDDLDAITLLTPPDWANMGQVFAKYLQNAWTKTIKLEVGGKIAGVGASIQMENSAWLAHIVVDSQFRRQGIGSRIVDALCKELEESGIRTISLLATDLGEPVYLRSGFRTVGSYEFLTLPEAFEEVNCLVRPFAEEDLHAVLDLDLDYSGEHRGWHLKPHLSSTILAFEADELKGYYAPGWGEGHIVAKSPSAAISLLSIRSQEKLTFCIPTENEAVRQMLLDKGAKSEEKYIVRMERGEALQWKAGWCCARIAGKLG